MSKTDKILAELGIFQHAREDNLLSNLTRIPPREPYETMPHTVGFKENASQQVDTVYMPYDEYNFDKKAKPKPKKKTLRKQPSDPDLRYKYLLVAVDVATGKCDAEPMIDRDSKTTATALKAIYKRKILLRPERLEVDDGVEFKGDFKAAFDKLHTMILTKMPGRSRQQSIVESKNRFISTILVKKMLADEINGQIDTFHWVKILPEVIKLINKVSAHEPAKPDATLPIVSTGTEKKPENIIPIGTNVRVKLDKPVDYTKDKTLHGKFRSGDIRWTREPKPITDIYLRPGFPVMYQVGGNDKVGYTAPQLQIVSGAETRPSTQQMSGTEIENIVRRYKIGNRVYFEIKFKNKNELVEMPRTELVKTHAALVRAFESA